jgi:pimeloyl-ACP methyl ester carboxylesterase
VHLHRRLDRPTGRHAAIALVLAMIVVAACSSTPPSTSAPSDASASGAPSSGAPASGAPTGSLDASAPLASPSATPVALIRWRDCGNGFQCGIVPVPLDAVHPTAAMLNLTVSRLAATDQSHRIGSLVINPGGPGEPATDFIRDAEKSGLISKDIRARFDIVGFDPPGVGLSAPIRCSETADRPVSVDADPDTSAEIAALVADAKELADGCEKDDAALLPHMGVEDVARDLDAVRAALGDEKLTYVGFSYGTLIGAKYASLFPDRIRALVLDGPVDPSIDLFQLREDQARAFEKSLNLFLADCAARKACAFYSNGRPAAAFDALMASIDKEPIPSSRIGRGPLGPTLALQAVLHSMYSRNYWPVLEVGLEAAALGDGSVLMLLSDPFRGRHADGTYSNLLDAYYGVTCLDWPVSHDVKAYTALAKKLSAFAPRLGGLVAYNDLPCAYWPVESTREPSPISAPKAPPMVIVAATGDPATPYKWGVSLSKQLTTSVLLTREGDGHTSYLTNTCVTKSIDAYLLNLKLPKAGLRCD